tara:strand:- start:198 stop:857 length:660 start_codon:yes stop_codon:yes gene_type:complete
MGISQPLNYMSYYATHRLHKAEHILLPELVKRWGGTIEQFTPAYGTVGTQHRSFVIPSNVKLGDHYSWNADKPNITRFNQVHGSYSLAFNSLPERFKEKVKQMAGRQDIKINRKTVQARIPGHWSPWRPAGKQGYLQNGREPMDYCLANHRELRNSCAYKEHTFDECSTLFYKKVNKDPDILTQLTEVVAILSCVPLLIQTQVFNTCANQPNYDLHPTT